MCNPYGKCGPVDSPRENNISVVIIRCERQIHRCRVPFLGSTTDLIDRGETRIPRKLKARSERSRSEGLHFQYNQKTDLREYSYRTQNTRVLLTRLDRVT